LAALGPGYEAAREAVVAFGPPGVEHRREPHPNHRRDNTMTESTDKSAEMMRFNNEQRDPDMQRRISERTPLRPTRA